MGIDPTTASLDASSKTLEALDLESWAVLLPKVRVGGALPVTFRADGDHVLIEAIVPYVSPPRTSSDPNRIPLSLADGFPVSIVARYKLPPYSPVNAAHFIRHIVREIYHHEIDEQFYVDNRRPFAPEH